MSHQAQYLPGVTLQQGDPVACFNHWRASLDTSTASLLVVRFNLCQNWLESAPALPLTALYCLEQGDLRIAVTDQELPSVCENAVQQFDNWVRRYGLMVIVPGAELELQPTVVPKPWGREIWYSGVEQRGVCQVIRDGSSLPLPWFRAVLPDQSCGPSAQPMLLLKILDPAPQPVIGDLYFELHREKREAYIIDRVDPGAWPDGVGYIRCGFSADKRAQWDDEQDFRRAYLEAVLTYEGVRRQIDAVDGDIVPAEDLSLLEASLRARMESFTNLRPLRKGDVIAVPPLLPHALQHGVRSIEFQTPVYERKILSFAQRVLTQDHWDTTEVLQEMLLEEPPPAQEYTYLARHEGLELERVIDFPDFEVQRLRLDDSAGYSPQPFASYALVMVAEGELALNGARYHAGQALLLPSTWGGRLAAANPAQPLVLLLAIPRR